jgi:PTS system mannitol-specific IIC component
VASVIIRRTPATETDDEDESRLAQAAGQMEAMKGSKSSVTGTLAENGKDEPSEEPSEEREESFDYSRVNKIIFACDAGMGSSAMGASLLKDKAKKAGLTDIEVKNASIEQVPDDADIVITHKDLTDRARQKLPGARHVSVDNFLGSPKYDELIDEISTARV